jgi:hypothetical protein
VYWQLRIQPWIRVRRRGFNARSRTFDLVL